MFILSYLSYAENLQSGWTEFEIIYTSVLPVLPYFIIQLINHIFRSLNSSALQQKIGVCCVNNSLDFWKQENNRKITNLVAAALFSFPWMISQTSVDCMKTCNFIEERCVAKKQNIASWPEVRKANSFFLGLGIETEWSLLKSFESYSQMSRLGHETTKFHSKC